MALKEIQIKRISELPLHQKESLRTRMGDDAFNRHTVSDALVEITVSNSIPHIGNIVAFNGTFSDRLLADVNGGKRVDDIFK